MLGEDSYMDTNMMALEPKGIDPEYRSILLSIRQDCTRLQTHQLFPKSIINTSNLTYY